MKYLGIIAVFLCTDVSMAQPSAPLQYYYDCCKDLPETITCPGDAVFYRVQTFSYENSCSRSDARDVDKISTNETSCEEESECPLVVPCCQVHRNRCFVLVEYQCVETEDNTYLVTRNNRELFDTEMCPHQSVINVMSVVLGRYPGFYCSCGHDCDYCTGEDEALTEEVKQKCDGRRACMDVTAVQRNTDCYYRVASWYSCPSDQMDIYFKCDPEPALEEISACVGSTFPDVCISSPNTQVEVVNAFYGDLGFQVHYTEDFQCDSTLVHPSDCKVNVKDHNETYYQEIISTCETTNRCQGLPSMAASETVCTEPFDFNVNTDYVTIVYRCTPFQSSSVHPDFSTSHAFTSTDDGTTAYDAVTIPTEASNTAPIETTTANTAPTTFTEDGTSFATLTTSRNEQISSGEIAGVAVGVAVIVILVVFLVVFFVVIRPRRHKSDPTRTQSRSGRANGPATGAFTNAVYGTEPPIGNDYDLGPTEVGIKNNNNDVTSPDVHDYDYMTVQDNPDYSGPKQDPVNAGHGVRNNSAPIYSNVTNPTSQNDVARGGKMEAPPEYSEVVKADETTLVDNPDYSSSGPAAVTKATTGSKRSGIGAKKDEVSSDDYANVTRADETTLVDNPDYIPAGPDVTMATTTSDPDDVYLVDNANYSNPGSQGIGLGNKNDDDDDNDDLTVVDNAAYAS